MNISEMLKAGGVMRFHSVDFAVRQDLKQHSWEACMFALHINPNCSFNVIKYLLTHDVAERYTGDVPAPFKKEFKEVKELLDQAESGYNVLDLDWAMPKLTESEYILIKYADILSGVYFSNKRAKAGDEDAEMVRDEFLKYIGAMPYNHTVDQLLKEIVGENYV